MRSLLSGTLVFVQTSGLMLGMFGVEWRILAMLLMYSNVGGTESSSLRPMTTADAEQASDEKRRYRNCMIAVE